MGDMAEIYNSMRDRKRALRDAYGVPCPDCVRLLPKADPSILLPQQTCRIHGYKDERPLLTKEQKRKAVAR